VSLASQNIRTYVRDGYTDTKNSSAALPENEYLCNKDSKKSLQFFIPKEKTKTVPGKHLYHPHLLLHTFRTAIKNHSGGYSSQYRLATTILPHHRKARSAP